MYFSTVTGKPACIREEYCSKRAKPFPQICFRNEKEVVAVISANRPLSLADKSVQHMNWHSLFPPHSVQDWHQRLQKDLRGGDFDQLSRKLTDDLSYFPAVHRSEQGQAPAPLLTHGPSWHLGEYINFTAEPETDHEAVMAALEGGADCLSLRVLHEPSARDWRTLLKGVYIDAIHLQIHFEQPKLSTLQPFLQWLQEQPVARDTVSATIITPFAASDFWVNFCALAFASFPNIRFVAVDNRTSQDDPAATLTKAAQGLVKAHQLLSYGVAPDRLHTQMSIGKHYFFSIALQRAWSIVWNNVLDQFGYTSQAPWVEVHFAQAAQGSDENTNKIQATTQFLSGILGNAATITPLPSDAQQPGEGSPFNRRIARNVSHLLKMESHLDKVEDTASGSYFFEHLTELVATEIWQHYQTLIAK